MRINNLFICLFFCLLFCVACNTNYKADSLPKEQLHFGRSGGFTGATVNYILVDSGQLFEDTKDDTRAEVGKIPAGKAKKLLKRASELKWNSVPKPPPGNMNSTLAYHSLDGYVFQMNWTRPDMPNLEGFTSLHQDLLKAYQAQVQVEPKQ